MLRKAIVVVALVLFPAIAGAQVRGPFEITVAANAVNGNKFNGIEAGGNGSIGYFLSDSFEISARQSVNYSDIGRPVALNASTRLAADLHLPLFGDMLLPFGGANIGYVYGKGVRDTVEAAPEVGIKWFVGQEAFIFAEVEYQFFFKNGVNNTFKNGQFVYDLGVGFRF